MVCEPIVPRVLVLAGPAQNLFILPRSSYDGDRAAARSPVHATLVIAKVSCSRKLKVYGGWSGTLTSRKPKNQYLTK